MRRLRPRRFTATARLEPLAMLANLFDAAFVFALAFLLALLTYHRLPELLLKEQDITVIKKPGHPDMEITVKKGKKLEHYRATDQSTGGRGRKLGTAYQLDTGEVVYIPIEKEGVLQQRENK